MRACACRQGGNDAGYCAPRLSQLRNSYTWELLTCVYSKLLTPAILLLLAVGQAAIAQTSDSPAVPNALDSAGSVVNSVGSLLKSPGLNVGGNALSVPKNASELGTSGVECVQGQETTNCLKAGSAAANLYGGIGDGVKATGVLTGSGAEIPGAGAAGALGDGLGAAAKFKKAQDAAGKGNQRAADTATIEGISKSVDAVLDVTQPEIAVIKKGADGLCSLATGQDCLGAKTQPWVDCADKGGKMQPGFNPTGGDAIWTCDYSRDGGNSDSSSPAATPNANSSPNQGDRSLQSIFADPAGVTSAPNSDKQSLQSIFADPASVPSAASTNGTASLQQLTQDQAAQEQAAAQRQARDLAEAQRQAQLLQQQEQQAAWQQQMDAQQQEAARLQANAEEQNSGETQPDAFNTLMGAAIQGMGRSSVPSVGNNPVLKSPTLLPHSLRPCGPYDGVVTCPK